MERKAPGAIMFPTGSADCGIERNVEENVRINSQGRRMVMKMTLRRIEIGNSEVRWWSWR